MEYITEITKKNINFDFLLDGIKPITKYGILCKDNSRPFLYGQEKELEDELNKVEICFKTEKRREIIDALKQVKYIRETLLRAKDNVILDDVELFEVKKFLVCIDRLKKSLRGVFLSKYDELELKSLPDLFKMLDPTEQNLMTFYIYDAYSEELKNIRKEKREKELQVGRLQNELKLSLQKKYDIKFNLKSEVVINKEFSEKIAELELEDSLFICGENYLSKFFKLKNNSIIDEILAAIELLKQKEDDEEQKIRERLTLQIGSFSDVLQKNELIIGRLDYLIAKANFAQKTNSTKPIITKELCIEIKNGKNLKLQSLLKEKKKEYTAISVDLNKKITCITGANMGGKTVSLRMIGQIACAASYGMYVPCEYATLCLFEHVHISVGDSQSIERGLSTFGSEILNVKHALSSSKNRSLILIDELAGGTNPKEGYAITKAITQYLKNSNSMSILTTHYDNIANDKDIQNYQVKGLNLPENIDTFSGIDEISRYMDYSLIEVNNQDDIPKDAIKIAKMAGIPIEIIELAEEIIKTSK